MAGIEFDRQIFAPSASETPTKPAPQAFGAILLVVVLGLAGFVGYKIFTQTSQANAIAAANAKVEQLQQQLADSQKRIEELEKHRKAARAEAPVVVAQPAVVKISTPPRPVYRVSAASALPPQPKPAPV